MSTTPAVVPHPQKTLPIFAILRPLSGLPNDTKLPLVYGRTYAIEEDTSVRDATDFDGPFPGKELYLCLSPQVIS